jgi:hypothetical protein
MLDFYGDHHGLGIRQGSMSIFKGLLAKSDIVSLIITADNSIRGGPYSVTCISVLDSTISKDCDSRECTDHMVSFVAIYLEPLVEFRRGAFF